MSADLTAYLSCDILSLICRQGRFAEWRLWNDASTGRACAAGIVGLFGNFYATESVVIASEHYTALDLRGSLSLGTAWARTWLSISAAFNTQIRALVYMAIKSEAPSKIKIVFGIGKL